MSLDLSILIAAQEGTAHVRPLLSGLSEVLPPLVGEGKYEILVLATEPESLSDLSESEPAVKVARCGEGYGSAIAEGVRASRGRYLLTMDADLAHSAHIVPMLYAHRSEAEIVIASRYASGGFNGSRWLNRTLSATLNRIYRLVLDLPIHDMSSGFRLYHRRVFDEVEIEDTHYGAVQEILIKAYGQGFRILEAPFHYYHPERGSAASKLFRFGAEYLWGFFRFWKLRNSITCSDYDQRAFRSRIWFQRYWQRKRYAIVVGYARACGRILDVGCGSSQILEGLPQAVGCDVQINKLRHMRAAHRGLVQGSVMHLPFKSGEFEATVFSQVIEHLPRDRQILDEVIRVTRDGGFIIVGTPDYATHWPLIEKVYGFVQPTGYADEHITHYTRASLTKEMEQRGCRYIDHQYVFGAELIMKFQKGGEGG